MSTLSDQEHKPSQPAPKGNDLFFLKMIFALEYVLQGIGNPFQGITYQPFMKHFQNDFGVSEAATQGYFSKSYLAWSFKPLLGFFLDAWGKTRLALILCLSVATIGYVLTPYVGRSADVFFWYMFTLSVFLAATDVAVDRATVITGDAESGSSGKSKATTVGLNQAICWAAIYGTSILAAIFGGQIAETGNFDLFITLLAAAPAVVLLVAYKLPKDVAQTIPVKTSIKNFWEGLNTGPVLWIIVFYFIFHFQPAAGTIWTNHLIQNLGFTEGDVGMTDAAAYVGLFAGVLLFARYGVRWQDAVGLKRVFKIFIVLSALVSLTQYVLVDPWFTKIANVLSGTFGVEATTARMGFLAAFNVFQGVFLGFTRMSTFSLVGSVIRVDAAGSLFAGFMSVANLAYSFSYGSGALLYARGTEVNFLRDLQSSLFGISVGAGDPLSINMLILIGSLAYFLSFMASHMLPDRRQTAAHGDVEEYLIGPEHFASLGAERLQKANALFFVCLAVSWSLLFFVADQNPIATTLLSFFGSAFVRKVWLDSMYKAHLARLSRGT